jgi:hypothetical protein
MKGGTQDFNDVEAFEILGVVALSVLLQLKKKRRGKGENILAPPSTIASKPRAQSPREGAGT